MNDKESKVYVLVEMSDRIAESLDNIKSVIEQQSTLIDIVEASDKSDLFNDFTVGLRDQINDFKTQSDKLANQKAALDTVIEMCRTNEEVNNAVNELIVGFNIQNS